MWTLLKKNLWGVSTSLSRTTLAPGSSAERGLHTSSEEEEDEKRDSRGYCDASSRAGRQTTNYDNRGPTDELSPHSQSLSPYRDNEVSQSYSSMDPRNLNMRTDPGLSDGAGKVFSTDEEEEDLLRREGGDNDGFRSAEEGEEELSLSLDMNACWVVH